MEDVRRKREEGRGKREDGRRKREEGRWKKEEGRGMYYNDHEFHESNEYLPQNLYLCLRSSGEKET